MEGGEWGCSYRRRWAELPPDLSLALWRYLSVFLVSVRFVVHVSTAFSEPCIQVIIFYFIDFKFFRDGF